MKGDFPEIVEYGFCYCGCGEKTKLAPWTLKSRGWIKDEPMKFIHGHRLKPKFGKDHPRWNGGRNINKPRNVSYYNILMPEHPRSNIDGYVKEHVMIVEKALSFPIGKKAVIHHVDGNGLNNDLSNLMVFKNNAEHIKFHAKLRREKL